MGLYVSNNQLTGLDVSNNPELMVIYVSNNQLTGLDVSSNTALWGFDVSNNQLTGLDVSSNPALEWLHVHHNHMVSPDDVIGWELRFNHAGYTEEDFFRFFPQDTPNGRPTDEEPRVDGLVRVIVRDIILNIWGRDGLLHREGITGVPIPPVLFTLVDTEHWETWFVTNHSWE
jgi:hypothetical protein